GVSGICKGALAKDNELLIAQELFECLGQVMAVDESKMDIVTAVSGSGPGYLLYLVENIDDSSKRVERIKEIIPDYIKAAKENGFSRIESEFFATTTAKAAISYLEEHPELNALQKFRKQVTSKNGTTQAAIDKLKSGGSLSDAVKAAIKRAKELSEYVNKVIKKRK
ncbi:MAG: hypothetical protein NG737_07350, partial [Omnitrophica bacterium]|nr:hypothetical protein [Candidatus Omnitrophota bacterium]